MSLLGTRPPPLLVCAVKAALRRLPRTAWAAVSASAGGAPGSLGGFSVGILGGDCLSSGGCSLSGHSLSGHIRGSCGLGGCGLGGCGLGGCGLGSCIIGGYSRYSGYSLRDYSLGGPAAVAAPTFESTATSAGRRRRHLQI